APYLTCGERPEGTVANAEDCDDVDATVHPGAVDVCGDDVDGDCDGVVRCPKRPDARIWGDVPGGPYNTGAAVHIADLDGDGQADLLVGRPNEVHLFRGPITGDLAFATSDRAWWGPSGWTCRWAT